MKKKLLSICVLAVLMFSGCVKDKIEDYEAKSYVKRIINSVYYWSKSAPTDVNMKRGDIYKYFKSSLYSEDRWSWMTSYEEWTASETGVYLSYGASISQPIEYYGDYSVKVRYVFPGSPFALQGVTRGWTMTHLNDVPIMELVKEKTFNEVYSNPTNKFTFLDINGSEHTFEATASTISTKSYIYKDIFTSDDYPGLSKPVGYFNYLTFNKNMLSDISTVLGEFSNAGVGDLILDLRYNGGGNTKALEELSSFLVPVSKDGSVLAVTEHNERYSGRNATTFIIRNANALDLSRIFIITGGGSASASEVLINGLRPIMGKENVIMVGDTTYGKPNGMYVYPFPEGTEEDYYGSADYIFYPICFFTTNSQGEQIDVNGMIPTEYRPDDMYHDWGVDEDLIGACLHYIASGTFPELPVISKAGGSSGAGSLKIATEEDSPHWGVYSVEYFRP